MEKWIETETTVSTLNWKGEPIQLPNVKAFKDPKTGEIMVYPSEVAKAEISQVANELDICPRDVGTLLMILVKPGNFNEGDVFYKYHLQKMLFLLWKSTIKIYGEALQLDAFIPAENGPVPKNLNADLERFEQCGIVETKREKTEFGYAKRIILTDQGKKLASLLLSRLAKPYVSTALNVKKRIYPLTPEQVRHLIHKEFPEYRSTYTENDIE